jgi:hypothetical protein
MLFEDLFHHSPCAGSLLAPNQRQMLKISSGQLLYRALLLASLLELSADVALA